MDSYVINLQKDLPIEKIGGKALNLGKLIRSGFHIPPAIVVTVEAYDKFIQKELEREITEILDLIDFDDEKSISIGCSRIHEIITSVELPENVWNDIAVKIPDGYYAVRSSAISEDMPDASFAGQLDSYLNVKKEDIPEKVVECWASYWNERAVKYRHDAGIEHLETGIKTDTDNLKSNIDKDIKPLKTKKNTTGIAVLVQKMVDADVSGVMFTSNPVDGSDSVVIESTWGLGEAIVSGTVTPDIYSINRDGDILEENIKMKEKGYYLVDGKNLLKDIPINKKTQPSLNSHVLKELVDVGIKLENFFQVAQDIEWAADFKNTKNGQDKPEIYILQSRPVTTLKEKDDILWTRAYGDEYWADATTPLFYDVMGKMLTDYVNHEGARIMGYSDITDTRLLKLHKSRVYFNSWVLEKAFSYYPKFARSKELLNYFPLDDQERISQYPSNIHKTILSQILIAIRDPDGMMHKTDKAYRRWAARFMDKCKSFDEKDLTRLSDEELLLLYDEIEQAGIKHYQLIRYGMVSHSIATNLMIKNWLLNWLDDQDGALYAGLISGLDDNKTVEMNIRFSNLARIVRDDSRLNHLEQLAPEKISSNPQFKEMFDSFMYDYGHRSNTREILYPRWKEDETYVLGVIKALSTSDLDLRKKETESREHRIKTQEEVQQRIKKTGGGFLKAKIFNIVLGLAQTYLTFRENQRFYLDHLLFRQRLIILEMGERLTHKNLIDEIDDVFFLYEAELFHLFAEKHGTEPKDKANLEDKTYSEDKTDLDNKISARKKEFHRYKSILPPKFLKNGVEFDDTILEYNQNAVYGAAASPGIYTGTARVVADIEDLSLLQDDEILITSNTDPAWTAVFSKIGGLITETGGILSHGAVISREYRIPAVTAVKGATELFKTGEKLMVDGNEGVVYKKE